MTRLETRVTSVQVVQGFPACLAIPNPPGWDRDPPSHSIPTVPLEAHIEPGRQPIEDAEGSTYATPPPSTPTPTWRPDTFTGNLCPSQPEPSPLPLDTVTKLLLGTPSGHTPGPARTERRPHRPGQFNHQKVCRENTSVNYTIRRGDWLETPPAALDFSSCKDGPIFYVNEVTDKKVSQIWKWDVALAQWRPVMEGDVFHTVRERRLELDENRIPRLRAVRKRQRASASRS